jgi:GNAT superfamily N-acetyltransferase
VAAGYLKLSKKPLPFPTACRRSGAADDLSYMERAMIIEVDKNTVLAAAAIHSESWKASHETLCSEAFLNQHTVERQIRSFTGEMRHGKRLYMLLEETPVGIVSVKDSLIENLYVLPGEQGRGYGTQLLLFALRQCDETPHLWILEKNRRAFSLYAKYGFRATGKQHRLSPDATEIELSLVRPIRCPQREAGPGHGPEETP